MNLTSHSSPLQRTALLMKGRDSHGVPAAAWLQLIDVHNFKPWLLIKEWEHMPHFSPWSYWPSFTSSSLPSPSPPSLAALKTSLEGSWLPPSAVIEIWEIRNTKEDQFYKFALSLCFHVIPANSYWRLQLLFTWEIPQNLLCLLSSLYNKPWYRVK